MAKEPATKAPETPTETVRARTIIDHDGTRYVAGAVITMTPEQAAALYALDAAEPVTADAAPAA